MYLPRFRSALAAIKQLEQRERWERADIEQFQLERINSIWRRAIESVPYYSELFRTRSLPTRFASLEEYSSLVPPLEKSLVSDKSELFLSSAATSGKWHYTGGSTGAPTAVYWSTTAHRQNLAVRYRCQAAWGVDFLSRQAMLWGHAASFARGWKGSWAKWKQPLIDKLRGRLRMSAYEMGASDLEGYLEKMLSFGPTTLYGYSSAVLLLARRARELGTTCPSLKLCMVSGEPAFAWMKQEIEESLQAPCSVEYGSVECGVMANEGPDRKLRVREDTTLIETVPRGDADTGEGHYDILVSVLINPDFPLLRFKVGDFTSSPIEKPERGFAILSDVAGRSNDLLKSRSGRLVHSLSVKHVFEQYESIRRFRAHQDQSGQLNVLVEMDQECKQNAGGDFREASAKLSGMLEGYPVSIDCVETLPTTSAGKHRWVISDLVES